MNFKARILQKVISDLRNCYQVRAIWEGGSAATATSDQYSDIDINILAADPINLVFETLQNTLRSVSEISHIWNEPKSFWPDLTQKIYFLKDAPKHFFLDVAVFPEKADKILEEFMQLERHGHPVIHFDDTGRIKTQHINKQATLEKHRKRLSEIMEAFPAYRTNVFKELDRGHSIDAFAFYQGGMLRPLVEVLGMLYRPFQSDFGLRYLNRTFPVESCRSIEKFLYVTNLDDLRNKATELEKLFYDSVAQAEKSLERTK